MNKFPKPKSFLENVCDVSFAYLELMVIVVCMPSLKVIAFYYPWF